MDGLKDLVVDLKALNRWQQYSVGVVLEELVLRYSRRLRLDVAQEARDREQESKVAPRWAEAVGRPVRMQESR